MTRPPALQHSHPAHEPSFRDFKETVYPLFESDTLFLECVLVLCLVVSDFSNQGMSKQYPLTVFLEHTIGMIWLEASLKCGGPKQLSRTPSCMSSNTGVALASSSRCQALILQEYPTNISWFCL